MNATNLTRKSQFDTASATLCARMVSLDAATRAQAAKDAQELLSTLPKQIRKSPGVSGEIKALKTLIAKNS